MPQSDKRGWWQKGHTQTERAKSVGYLVKYTSKNHVGDGLAFPEGMRIYGAGGLEGDGLALHRHGQKPAWMKLLIPLGEKFKRVSGGVLRCATGEWWQCPYSIVVEQAAGLWCIRCVRIPDERLQWVRADGSTNIPVVAEFTFGVQVWLRWERLEAERREERKALWSESFSYSDGWGCSPMDEFQEALN